jgi:hypothetical protein
MTEKKPWHNPEADMARLGPSPLLSATRNDDAARMGAPTYRHGETDAVFGAAPRARGTTTTT